MEQKDKPTGRIEAHVGWRVVTVAKVSETSCTASVENSLFEKEGV